MEPIEGLKMQLKINAANIVLDYVKNAQQVVSFDDFMGYVDKVFNYLFKEVEAADYVAV